MVEQKENFELSKEDLDKYSRAIGTMGKETMVKLRQLNVLVIGMRGLGFEIAKNLVLAGVKSVTLHDPTMTQISDLGSNFYLKPEHVGKVTRAEACLSTFEELNPDTRTSVDNGDVYSEESAKKYVCVCVTENQVTMPKLIAFNEVCRKNNTKFILTETPGPTAYAFLDFGNEHVIHDPNGEDTKVFQVVGVTSEAQAIVTLEKDPLSGGKFNNVYEEGMTVKFIEVRGMTELNGMQAKVVDRINGYKFKIDLDTSSFTKYESSGVVENVKTDQKVSYHSLEESVANPVASNGGMFMPVNQAGAWDRPGQLHVAMRAVHEFQVEKGTYPSDCIDDIARCQELAQKLKIASVDEVNDKVVKRVAQFSRRSISPMCALFGGLIGQEIIKSTGKYTPLKQWIHCDIFQTLPSCEFLNRAPKDCRYDDQIAIYGREIQESIENIKTFMIGSGALGCELIKAFALMGVGCGPEGEVVVTDNDTIALSNLNRQFLFRLPDVDHGKSEVACAAAKVANPDINLKPRTDMIYPATESIYNDKFWNERTFVVNAVDNQKARLYVDSRCSWFEKPLLESGTLGVMANSQMIIPHETQSYGDHEDPPQDAVPMCTLKSYPFMVEHCIEWARERFGVTFTKNWEEFNNFVADPDRFMTEMKKSREGEIDKVLATISGLLTLKMESSKIGGKPDAICMQYARDMYDRDYNHAMKDLTTTFPLNHEKDGQKFWQGSKRFPDAFAFNVEEEYTQLYMFCMANLLMQNLGMPCNRDEAQMKELAKATKELKYVYEVFQEEKKEGEKATEEVEEVTIDFAAIDAARMKTFEELKSLVKGQNFQAEPADFEKDDDKNFHIDFIMACSNLRATNYHIVTADRHKTKMVSGNIIPAIATTTACITGFVTADIYLHAQGITDRERFTDGQINLAFGTLQAGDPFKVRGNKSGYSDEMFCEIECIPEDWTGFTKIVVDKGSMTLKELIDWLQTEYEINRAEDSMAFEKVPFAFNGKTLMDCSEKHQAMKLEDIAKDLGCNLIEKNMKIKVQGYIGDKYISMAPLKYIFP